MKSPQITDDEIREARERASIAGDHERWHDCNRALAEGGYKYDPRDLAARERIAAAINAVAQSQHECRACGGEGFIVGDGLTPANERVTRDSRRCPYCRGTGGAR